MFIYSCQRKPSVSEDANETVRIYQRNFLFRHTHVSLKKRKYPWSGFTVRQRIIETSREQTILVTKRDNGALRVPTVCKLKTHSDKLQASIRSTVCSFGRSVGRSRDLAGSGMQYARYQRRFKS